MSGSLLGEPLPCAVTQRNIGLEVNKSLSWDDNCLTRTRKALKALSSLKRNLSTNSILVVKMNDYTGYVVPILAYCSQAWYPNITAFKDLEKIKKIAVKWIFDSSTGDDFKNELRKLKLLPLSMYFEIHDLLLLLKPLDRDYEVRTDDVIKITEMKTTAQAFRNELKITETKHSKCNDNFFRHAAILHNMFLRFTKPLKLPMDKNTIMRIYWQYFDNCFFENLPCTWRLLCKCGNCNPLGKLKTIQDQN